jgi:hypothetical protein
MPDFPYFLGICRVAGRGTAGFPVQSLFAIQEGPGDAKRGGVPAGADHTAGLMSSILLFIENVCFGPTLTSSMGAAFDKACQSLGDRGLSAVVREVIAKRIIQLAKKGVHDPDELCERVLNEIGVTRPPTMGDETARRSAVPQRYSTGKSLRGTERNARVSRGAPRGI